MAKAVTKPELVSTQLPDFLKNEQGGLGAEGLSTNALTPPRLKLIQALSPEVEVGAKPGDYYNNITEANYGPSVQIIPCWLSEAYFLFAPRVPGSTGGLLARSMDAVHWNPPDVEFDVVINKQGKHTKWKTAKTVSQSGLDKWGTFDPDDPKSPPAATHTINCLALLPDDSEAGPSVLSFLRSSLKIGKKFAGNLKLSRVPSFGRIFQLTSLKVDGVSGPYYEPRVKALGFVGDVTVYDTAREYYNMAKDRGVDVDLSSEVHEGGNGEATSDKY